MPCLRICPSIGIVQKIPREEQDLGNKGLGGSPKRLWETTYWASPSRKRSWPQNSEVTTIVPSLLRVRIAAYVRKTGIDLSTSTSTQVCSGSVGRKVRVYCVICRSWLIYIGVRRQLGPYVKISTLKRADLYTSFTVHLCCLTASSDPLLFSSWSSVAEVTSFPFIWLLFVLCVVALSFPSFDRSLHSNLSFLYIMKVPWKRSAIDVDGGNDGQAWSRG